MGNRPRTRAVCFPVSVACRQEKLPCSRAALFSRAAVPAGTSSCWTRLFTLPGLIGTAERKNNGAALQAAVQRCPP